MTSRIAYNVWFIVFASETLWFFKLKNLQYSFKEIFLVHYKLLFFHAIWTTNVISWRFQLCIIFRNLNIVVFQRFAFSLRKILI